MEIIMSKENKLVKLIRALSSKKGREENKLFVLEGPKVLQEAIISDFEIYTLCIRDDIYEKTMLGESEFSWLKKEIEKSEAGESLYKIQTIEKNIFNNLSLTESSQGVMALLKITESEASSRLMKKIMEDSFCFLALDEIQDPGNMGTIIRTAEAFGIEGILIGKGSVDIYNDKVLRGTMGSVLRMPIFQIENLGQFLKEQKNRSVMIVGADPHSEVDFRNVERGEKTILVIGNEAKGLSQEVRDCLSTAVTIPMLGRAESLNAGIAAALMAYEFRVNKKVEIKLQP